MSNGNFAGGDGTASNPYLIEDAADLNAVRNNLSASYKLIKNIDLNIAPYNTGEGWTPGGEDYSTRFTGTFDGDGYIIKNLYINRPTTIYVGLFGFTSISTIKNIRLINVNVTGSNDVGGLIGYNSSSTISNCYSTGAVSGSGNGYVGGLVGYNVNTTTISNSYSTGTVSGSGNGCVGGLVGGLIGGLINSTTISNCYSTGSISGSGNGYVGGLVGIISSSTISNCYSTGSISGSGSYVGGLVSYNDSAIVSNSYWDKEASGISTSAGGTGLTTVQMKTASSFVGWDTQLLDDGVTKIWKLKDGEYPKLWFEKAPSKFLIMQNNEYYSIQNNTIMLLGIPTDDTQLEEWFNTYGVDDLKDALLTPDTNGNKLIDSLDNQFEIRMMK